MEGLRPVILPNIVLEVLHDGCFVRHWLAKTVQDWLAIIPIRNVNQISCTVCKEEVVLLVLQFQLFLNDRHAVLLVVEAVPAHFLDLSKCFLHCMHQRKCPSYAANFLTS